jgi:hypothetical protein
MRHGDRNVRSPAVNATIYDIFSVCIFSIAS